jgi:excisionase family DNA binding protein
VSVYRLYDADDALLYVGITSGGARRLNDHRRAQGWWAQVHRATFEHHATRLAARIREDEAIAAERPRHNRTGGQPPRRTHSTADPLLTVDEVAARLKVNPETVRRWLRAKRIRGVMMGGKRGGYRVPTSEVERVAAEGPGEPPER